MSFSLAGITYSYPGTLAGVFDVNLQVETGELVAVIGPSGSGKSTILKLLAGFLVPDAGRITIGGAEVSRLPPQRRNLGVVFQSYALFPHMPVAENVAYPLKVRGIGRTVREARAREALERVGLAAFAGRSPATLSGGQQQRVALARALIFEPRGLLLDEPLSALDQSLRREMRDEIRRVQREAGIATLHVTHDQEEALSIADRVAVLIDGRLRQCASPAELYDNPVDCDVAAFVGEANLLKGEVIATDTVSTSLARLICRTGDRAPGTPVWVLVRPERISPLTNGSMASEVNSLSGSVSRDRFLGAVRQLDLETPSGAIRIETACRGPISGATIPPEAVRLLPRDINPKPGDQA